MSDEKRVTETLETIAGAEAKAELGVKLEAVHAEVRRVYDVVIAQREHNEANDAAHRRFEQQLADHDVRLLAIETRRDSA